jgi:hypothetical protein
MSKCGAPTVRLLLLSLGLLSMAGCQRSAPAEQAPEAPAKAADAGVSLSAEQVQKLGILTTAAQATDYSPETLGYGVVIAHDGIATAVAELTTAQAASAQSRAVAQRAQRLAGTSGAMAADTVENATRQAASDGAAVELAQRRLATVIGAGIPGGTNVATPLLEDLASGKVKLLRASFALGVAQGHAPPALRVAPLDGSQSWNVREIWSAPADPGLPGRSFFGLLKMSEVGEGERLLVWAPGSGPAQHGVSVPAAALVISDGKYWCYVEQQPGHYLRREVATDKPVGVAYFVTQGVAAGDKLVTAQAALLLAHETNPSTEAD